MTDNIKNISTSGTIFYLSKNMKFSLHCLHSVDQKVIVRFIVTKRHKIYSCYCDCPL